MWSGHDVQATAEPLSVGHRLVPRQPVMKAWPLGKRSAVSWAFLT